MAEEFHETTEQSNGLERLDGQVADAARQQQADWRAQIPEDVKNEKVWEQYRTPGDVYKAHANLIKYQGRSIAIPDPAAKPEDWDAFYNKLGRPESPDKYEIKRPEKLPEGMVYREDWEQLARQKLHAAGLTSKQMQSALDLWNNDIAPQIAQAGQGPSAEEAEVTLRSQWGANYQPNMANVEKFLRQFGDDSFVAALDLKGKGSDPAILTALARVGASLHEDSAIGTKGDSTKPDLNAIEQRYAEILTDKDYFDAGSPRHKLLHEERQRLWNQREAIRNAR